MRPADQPRDGRHRVRVGLTGLAVVFLLVLLAAAFFGLTSRDRGASGRSDPVAAVSRQDGDSPKEPLAELGVTPGNAPDQPLANGAATLPAKRPPGR